MNTAKTFRSLSTQNYTNNTDYDLGVAIQEKTEPAQSWKKTTLIISVLRATLVLAAVVGIVVSIQKSVAKIGSQKTYGYATYQAFFGDSCNGPDVGDVDAITLVPRCISITDRGSYVVQGRFSNIVVIVNYELPGCDINGNSQQQNVTTKGVCSLIDTTYGWNSASVWVES